MIPLRDSKNAGIIPFVTYFLIAINVFVFLLEFLSPDPDGFIARYALFPFRINFADWTTLAPFITHMFLHGGFLHILSNMWFLRIFGDNVEERFGKLTYLFIYIFSGISGAMLQFVFSPGSDIPMIGASGAVAGVLGAYLVFFPNHTIETIIPLGFLMTTANIPASVMLFYWFATQFFSGVGSIASIDTGGVAFWAHVGGFIAGYFFAKLAGNSRSSSETGELSG